MNDHIIELILITSTFTLLAGYHLLLSYFVHKFPLKTSIGFSNHVRTLWVKTIMSEKRDILAVQTLRNWTMAATFLASTSILIGVGALSVALTSERLLEISHNFNFFGVHSESVWMIKLLLISINFFIAFYNFTLAIRYYNNVGFMINVTGTTDIEITPESVGKTVNKGALHYTYGMRGYYFTLPLTLWLLGPSWSLGGALVLIFLLSRLDRVKDS